MNRKTQSIRNYLVATPVTVPAPAMLGLVAIAGFGLAAAAAVRRSGRTTV